MCAPAHELGARPSAGRAPRASELRFDPPGVPLDRVAQRLAEHWGIEGRLEPLEGERDQNTLVTTSSGERFVMKIASTNEDPAVADLQCAALAHLAATDPELTVPRVVPTVAGHLVATVTVDGTPTTARVVTHLPGVTFHDAGDLDETSLHGVGRFQARLAAAFRGFAHPAATTFLAWSLDAGMVTDDTLWRDASPASREAAEPHRARVEAAVDRLEGFPRQVVHNDAHRGNLLRSHAGATEVTGVIDFGDVAETALVADLAICVAGFVDVHPDPLGAACALVAGSHTVRPLVDAEVDLLADLVLMRYVLGVLLVDLQARHAPPHRLDEIAGELPMLCAAVTRWGSIDPHRAADALHRRLAEVAR